MQCEPIKYIVIIVMFWVVSVSASLAWNMFQLERSAELDHVKTAKAFSQQVLITRGWNASHGGLYLRVTEKLPPNPFLRISNRDIETTDGIQLTLINPPLMTRLISEFAPKLGLTNFHLTSLKPINPNNVPLPWEKTALQNFEKKQGKEYFFSVQENSTVVFHYIGPLVITKECLQCHKQQGYQEGDLRGGLSVSFPVNKKRTSALVFSHIFMLLFGVLLIAGFGRKIVRLTETLRKQSNIDCLTKIANRKCFDETLHREWLLSQRMKTSLSLILCDIDHFKQYNDTYGHQAGDSCLQQVAHALRTTVNRPADLVARYGGEEFVVVLPEISVEEARGIAELLRVAVENLQVLHKSSEMADYVTVSLGVATASSTILSTKELIKQADKALYASKQNGKNCIAHANDFEEQG